MLIDGVDTAPATMCLTAHLSVRKHRRPKQLLLPVALCRRARESACTIFDLDYKSEVLFC